MSEWIRIRVKDFYKDAVGELEYTYVTREVYEAPLKEHRVKLVNIFMQERRLLCKMQINSLYNQSSHFIQTILITLKSLPVGKS